MDQFIQLLPLCWSGSGYTYVCCRTLGLDFGSFNSHPISLSANVRVKVVGASAGVGSFVGNQIAGVAEGATAGVAAVRFLAGVCEHVLLVARLLCQALAANVAGEWLDAGVTEQMRAQRRCLAIGFSACLTLVGVVWIV